MSELSMQELEIQHGELLPEREALSIVFLSAILQNNAAANVSLGSIGVAQLNAQANVVS